jgi:transposase
VQKQAVIGVDPHKRVVTAVALDHRGGWLGEWRGNSSRQAIGELRAWADSLTREATWAIEGTNFLGRRLAMTLVEAGTDVRDVSPGRTSDHRRRRPGRGKSDAIDAEAIARELLAHPDLPHAFKTAEACRPGPARETLAVLVRERNQIVDRNRRLLNEAEALLTELPAELAERLPTRATVRPRLAAAARLRLTGDRLTDLRLRILRSKAREAAVLAEEQRHLGHEIARLLEEMSSKLPALFGLGPLGAATLLVEVGDPRRFRSADAFASYTGTAPIPASSAETHGRPIHHRLSRYGNRRLNSVLHIMAVTRLRTHPQTQTFVARAITSGKSSRDALRIVKRRLARQVWLVMMRDIVVIA